MAQKTTKKQQPKAKKSTGSARNNDTQPAQMEVEEEKNGLWTQIRPFILIVVALLLAICFFTGNGDDPGIIMGFLYSVLTGLFSIAAFLLPVFLVYAGIMSFLDRTRSIFLFRTVFGAVSAIFVAVLLELISPLGSFAVTDMFKRGTELAGGGAVGGLIGEVFLACFKSAGSFVIVIAVLILSVLLTAGLTPKYVFTLISVKYRRNKEISRQRREEWAAREKEKEEFVIPEDAPDYSGYEINEETGEVTEKVEIPPVSEKRRRKFDTDVPIDDIDGETAEEKRQRINDATYEEVMRRSAATKSKEMLRAEKAVFEDDDTLSVTSSSEDIPVFAEDIISDDDGLSFLDELANEYEKAKDASASSLSVQKETVSSPEKKEPEKPTQLEIKIPRPQYKYPPVELLTEDPGNKADNIRAELHENASKLVSVLASFNVKTKIVGVSRGPTITRYELLPEAGTRVRSIANLVDDIALNLATSGVRIEAPIPGKAAVGIEVPNKQAETVFLRSLISSDGFSDSKSKLTTALGEDVAGEPIIMDIAKMPHLLIAGATGMGKSVCINCLLMSLLYKASPEEVKLILIDPKKVEFSIYNGLPHLLVPVVSDPKKAAGSLNWAVNEMEKRFGLIESVGVRDIASYNKITANDPDREYMPQIVIVIDELADLMATAANDVETSIARLAAKARAAGMHLVIGTQRPSVDVITGVIKANIPSRIAFTVASQVDSRTIIDRSGAENLIGRGDMLYSPVGASKPIRVQGAFVSEKEVDAVVQFIKAQNMAGEQNYSDEVMKEIEAQAALCGNKKGSAPTGDSGDGESESDPLLHQAMEVAFESGKVSTSLLQRRLSVGYGRAAKIIDHMERAGYVSAPDGQKPRELLITKDQFMELTVKNEDL